MKIKTLPLLTFLSLNSFGASVNLLELPLSDKTTEVYSVELKDPCSFKGVTDIIIPKIIEPKDNIILDTLDNVQKKINWSISDKTITPELISFSLKDADNITFIFSFVDCKLKKEVSFNNRTYVTDSIDIQYDNTLSPPVVKNFILKDDRNIETNRFSPMQLDGQIASQELVLGPIVNIHTNIRINNQKSYERTHPVIKPVPGFMFRYGPLFLNREGVGSLAYSKNQFTILLMAQLDGEAYEAGGMRERKEGIFMGTTFKYNLAELSIYNDFFDERGFNIKLNFAPSFHYLTQWKFTPQAYVQYWDNHYVGKWIMLGMVAVKFYGQEIYSSPTVVKKNEMRLILGILYKIF